MKKLNKLLSLFLLFGTLNVSAQQTVYDIISASEVHSTLKTAIDLAGLSTTLDDSTKAYTVFAPTDDAFSNLPDGTFTALVSDPTGDLADILLYHVLGDSVASTSLSNGMIVDAVNTDNTLKITVKSAGGVYINQAMVSIADLRASNGIVHVIDAVLLPTETVADIAIDNEFTTLVTAVAAAELLPTLTNPSGTFTVFAPTNDAFDALGSVVTDLLSDPTGDLANILLYHVLGDSVASTSLSNGMIVDAVNTDNTLKITVKSAGGVYINQAMVSIADLRASNGIVHVIDAVLLPTETVVDIAIDNEFTTLVTAVVAAELLPALTNPSGTYTVFAPTNDAFSELGGTFDELLLNPTDDLADILLYHVVGQKALSTDLVDNSKLPTLLMGDSLMVELTNGTFINNASVTLPNIETGNGVVHVINKVLLPSNITGLEKELVTETDFFPNPTTQYINLKSEDNLSFRIANQSGMVLKTGFISKGLNTVDVNDLDDGQYFLNLSSETNTQSIKFIKN